MDLPVPGLVGELDPRSIGFVVIGPNGRVRLTWGLADRIQLLAIGSNLLDSPLHGLVESPESGCLFFDRHRYFSGVLGGGETALLVCAAQDEAEARIHSEVNGRAAELFRRIGKALSMHGNLEELAVLAAHEISSACDLAAVLLWTKSAEDEDFILRARVGVNRQGAKALETLHPEAFSCAADFVAAKRSVISVPNVGENVLTAQLEARFCFLPAKSMIAMPLVVADKLIGVLELIGREDDHGFEASHELFGSLSEHLSLALNTSLNYESIERLASFDPMTGIANHRTLQDFVAAQLNLAQRSDSPLGLLMIDVDHFRAFNEEEGHDAGDWVLKRVAEKLAESLRHYDLGARYGGEEFSAVLPGLALEQAFEVAERVRVAIESIEFTGASGNVRHVSASIGVAAYPETAAEANTLFKAADSALFQAKRAGRNCTVKFEGPYCEQEKEPDDDRLWLERWQTLEDISKAQGLWEELQGLVRQLGGALRLSTNQVQILERLIRILPSYRRLMQEDDPEMRRQMERAPEFRPLMPSLLAVNERYDGEGPLRMAGERIPLLARIVSVLVALAEENGEPLALDPHRFDPRICALVLDLSEAA